MMNSMSFSQNTQKTKQVPISTLKNIKKELDKCDSLRVAYDYQKKALADLVVSNLKFFNQYNAEVELRTQLQTDLDESINALKRKQNNWLMPTALGVLGGFAVGVLTSN